jgi:hypothetical protein
MTMSKMSDYQIQCDAAAREQGVDLVIRALRAFGTEADLLQTGGFTMCFGVARPGGKYILGNASGAAEYGSSECYPEDIAALICSFSEDSHSSEFVADAVAAHIDGRSPSDSTMSAMFRSLPFAAITDHEADVLAAEIKSGLYHLAMARLFDDVMTHQQCGNMIKADTLVGVVNLLAQANENGGVR